MLRKASADGKIPADARLTSQKEKGAQSISVSTVEGWRIGEEQDFVIYEVNSNNEVIAGSVTSWKGVSASNGTIANLTITGGIDRLYPIGAVVTPTTTSAWANDLISGLLKSHNPDGTLKESALPAIKPQVIPNKSITADKIDFTTMPLEEKVKVKRNNTTTDKPVNVQCGVAMLSVPSNALEATVQITFPKQFKTLPTVVCSFGGYGQPGDRWTDTPNSSWGGCAFSAVGVTNTSFTARCRRFDGAQLLGTYYVNWIAIG
jgi:hypothetical protein